MKHAILENGEPKRFTDRFAISEQGVQHPLRGLSKAEKLNYGVYEVRVERDPPPQGQKRTGTQLVLEGDEVIERDTYRLKDHEDLIRAVKRERDRRLSADFAFQGKLYQRDPASLARITGAATLAGFATGAGAQPGDYRWHGGETDFAWIASDDSLTLMDAQTAFAFGQLAANVETRIIFAAKALREMNPIPADYTDDRYWPDTTTP